MMNPVALLLIEGGEVVEEVDRGVLDLCCARRTGRSGERSDGRRGTVALHCEYNRVWIKLESCGWLAWGKRE